MNKTIVVTGGHGFLGRHTVAALGAAGYAVSAPTHGNPDNIDLRNVGCIHEMLSTYTPDIVVHLAARVGGIGANQANPATFFYDNLMMGVQLMHECWKRGVQKFVTVGTVCAYPKFTRVPFTEYSLWDGYPEETNAPYGLAKKMLLVQAQAYRQQHGFNAVVLFPTNLYGPGDNFDLEASHVIPAMIRKFVEAQDGVVTLWGDGSPTRDFLYVGDCADAIVKAVQSYDSSEPMNIGSGEETAMRQLAEIVRYACNYRGTIRWDATRPNGQPRRCLDISRARNILKWEPATSINDGLKKTVDWYLDQCAR